MTGPTEEPRSGLPRSIVFDPDEPDGVAASLSPKGTVVLLLSQVADRGWATAAAIELSSAWARGGRRIVLADLHLENPLLHEGLDASNLEGVVDIFLYGASLSRIAQPVRDGAFYLIPAGTYAPDASEIYRHPRWKKLVAGFKESDAMLLLFAPAEVADLEALSAWSSEAILLGEPPSGELASLFAQKGIEVVAVLEPPAAPVSAAPPIAGDLPRERAGAGAPPEAQRYADPGLELPPPPVRKKSGRHGVSAALWLFLAIVVVGAAGYLLATIRPDLVRQIVPNRAPPESGVGMLAPAPAQEASRVGELLPYSVQVKAFTSLPAALDDLGIEQRRVGAIPFFISPEEIQGILYYKILAGLSADTLEVNRLRQRLVLAGALDEQDAAGSWSLLQFTPLAFDLGEFPTEAEALLRADSLLSQEIPTYAAVVPYSDGSRRWQLYGGAYRDSASAGSMREILADAGHETRLTARAGLPVPAPE